MLLTDIAITHVYQGAKVPEPVTFTLHPVSADEGEHAGTYEILFSRRGAGDDADRAGHVTAAQLAELYARGIVAQRGIRLRLAPAQGDYPDTLPAKKVPRTAIVAGSAFDRQVRGYKITPKVSAELAAILAHMAGTD